MTNLRFPIALISAAVWIGCAHSSTTPPPGEVSSKEIVPSRTESPVRALLGARAPGDVAPVSVVVPAGGVPSPPPPSSPAASGPSCTGAAGAGNDCNGESCCARIAVPGGEFDMPLDGMGRVARVRVGAFAMDKYEATVGRIRAWIGAGQPLPEDGQVLYDDGGGKPIRWSDKTPVQRAKDLTGWARYDTWNGNNERRPKNFINWHTALAFCHYEGGRLPTEAEWKYAVAGGDEEREYPWGAEPPTPERAVFNCTGDGDQSCSLADILEVGSRPKGAGRWGHQDLAGSMFEWTLSKGAAGGYHDETSRGGGFCYIGGVDRRARTELRPLVYRRESADVVSHMVGVRCSYSI